MVVHTAPESLNTDVLIIGAGPAGLMAALTLSHLGVGVRVLDRRIAGETAGQGDGVQPRMTEIWDTLGIGAELRERGNHIHRMVIHIPNDDLSGIKEASQTPDIPVDSTPYPYETGLASSIMEGILLRALKARGVVIEQPFVPESLKIVEEGGGAGSHVEVSVVRLDEDYLQARGVRQNERGRLVETEEAIKARQIIHAKYVLGCDGAHSWVRKAVDIALEGETTDLVWGVIDFTPDTDFPMVRAKNVIASPLVGGVGYIPRENGTARVYVRLQTDPDSIAADETQKTASKDSRDKIIETIEKAFLPYTMRFKNITWCNEYKVGQRVAATFSASNRVFLLGDAGRTHSPLAGQGANGAMTDACNLAWKLAYVLQGRASPSLLDTYEAERRAHALELIQFDKNVFETFRPETFTVEAYVNLWERKIMWLCGVGIKCDSRLTVPDTESLAPGLRVGERVPWIDITRQSDWRPFNLLELMAYNGHFKLVVLPGDTRDAATAQRFRAFTGELVGRLGTDILRFLDIFTVLDAPREIALGELQLPPAFRAVENVYVDELASGWARQRGKLYENLKVGPEGAAIVVRPDGIMSMVTAVSVEHIDRLVGYFAGL